MSCSETTSRISKLVNLLLLYADCGWFGSVLQPAEQVHGFATLRCAASGVKCCKTMLKPAVGAELGPVPLAPFQCIQ